MCPHHRRDGDHAVGRRHPNPSAPSWRAPARWDRARRIRRTRLFLPQTPAAEGQPRRSAFTSLQLTLEQHLPGIRGNQLHGGDLRPSASGCCRSGSAVAPDRPSQVATWVWLPSRPTTTMPRLLGGGTPAAGPVAVRARHVDARAPGEAAQRDGGVERRRRHLLHLQLLRRTSASSRPAGRRSRAASRAPGRRPPARRQPDRGRRQPPRSASAPPHPVQHGLAHLGPQRRRFGLFASPAR